MIEHLSDEHGVLLRRDAVEDGVSDLTLHRLVRSGQLVRVRHGAYCDATTWQAADRAGRHEIASRAVSRLYRDDVAVSHASAAILQGAPDWELPLDEVHLTALDGTGQRARAGVRHHRGSCGVEDLTRVDGRWVTSPTRTVLDVAACAPRDAGVCVADDYLRRGLTTLALLVRALEQRADWPDHPRAADVVRLARPGAESVGETRTRLLLNDHGIRDIELQWPVRDAPGLDPFAFVDLYLPELGVLVEFDGRVKYGALLRPGESLEDCLTREKRREDRIRERTGLPVLRLTWADLYRPREVMRRLEQLARRAA